MNHDELTIRYVRLESAVNPALRGDNAQLHKIMRVARRRMDQGRTPINAINVFWAYIRLAEDHDKQSRSGTAIKIRETGQAHYIRLGGPVIPSDHPIVFWAIEQRMGRVLKDWAKFTKGDKS